MTIDIYYSVHTISFITSYKTKTKLLNRTLCKPYRIGNRGSYQKRTCGFKYSKHFYSQSLTSREFRWLEPDKSCFCDFFEVVFHYVVSPRITIENLETKVSTARLIPIPDLGFWIQLLFLFQTKPSIFRQLVLTIFPA